MKPRKKQEKPDESEHVRGVDDENHDQKSNTQEEDGGGYARPKASCARPGCAFRAQNEAFNIGRGSWPT